MADLLCGRALDEGDGEWVEAHGIRLLLEAIDRSDLQWLGGSFDGGYRENQGAKGFEILFQSSKGLVPIYRKWSRLPALLGWSFEAETLACRDCVKCVNQLLLQIFSIEKRS